MSVKESIGRVKIFPQEYSTEGKKKKPDLSKRNVLFIEND